MNRCSLIHQKPWTIFGPDPVSIVAWHITSSNELQRHFQNSTSPSHKGVPDMSMFVNTFPFICSNEIYLDYAAHLMDNYGWACRRLGTDSANLQFKLAMKMQQSMMLLRRALNWSRLIVFAPHNRFVRHHLRGRLYRFYFTR